MTIRDETLLTAAPPPDEESPAARPAGPARRVPAPLALVRNTWRRLTSMRTALILLFLLALASLPGALLPQLTLDQARTATWITDHGWVGRVLDDLDFFAVFSSPWYAAIYLLLFVSLIGCILPRTADFYRQLRQPPVGTPRNLARLPLHADATSPLAAAPAADRITAGLRGWRLVRRDEGDGAVTVSAEKGYLREVGNLVFHVSLVGLLIAVAVGKLFGYEASVLVNSDGSATAGFCSAPAAYDSFRPGLAVDGSDLDPFCVRVTGFDVAYDTTGQAKYFRAAVDYQSAEQTASRTPSWRSATVQVNDPLRIDGTRLYLLGHGYSPTFTVTYPGGATQTVSQPFEPGDDKLTSTGVAKFPDPPGRTGTDLYRNQLAVVGVFAPTSSIKAGVLTSSFPGPTNPGVAVQIYRGDLGLRNGPQSVFAIDDTQVASGALKQVSTANLTTGQSVTLDDGTRITYTGFVQWVSLQTSYDPAQGWALVFAVLLLLGLMVSLVVKRRRVWFRIRPAAGGSTGSAIEVGGLARTDQAGYGEEFARLVELAGPDPGSADAPGPRPARRREGFRG